MLANSDFSPLDGEMMKQGMNNYLSGTKSQNMNIINILVVDKKNGYIKANDMDNEFEFCYWNQTNGNKLLGFTVYGCGPICNSSWNFYEYSKNDGLSMLNNKDIIPSNFISDEEFFDFEKMEKNYTSEEYNLLKSECNINYKMCLPQKDKNIIIYFEPFSEFDLFDKIIYKNNYKGVKMIWKDGFFEKGKYLRN